MGEDNDYNGFMNENKGVSQGPLGLDRAVGSRSYLGAVPSDGVLANLVRLGHDLDTAVFVVLEAVAVHLQGIHSSFCGVHM